MSTVLMKTIKISVSKQAHLKETPEERKERVKSAGSSMFTRIVPNKKRLSSKQQRQLNTKEMKEWI